MHKQNRPRTPRYWPRMKVRGARRKRLRTMYAFQRIGDAGVVTAQNLNALGKSFVAVQKAINDMHIRHQIVTKYYAPYGGPADAETLDRLGISITEVDSGSDI